jgi:hypothetical protein
MYEIDASGFPMVEFPVEIEEGRVALFQAPLSSYYPNNLYCHYKDCWIII